MLNILNILNMLNILNILNNILDYYWTIIYRVQQKKLCV